MRLEHNIPLTEKAFASGLPIVFRKQVYFDSGAKSSGGREDSESSGPRRRNSSEGNSGDFLDLKVSVTAWGKRQALRLIQFRNQILPRPRSY